MEELLQPFYGIPPDLKSLLYQRHRDHEHEYASDEVHESGLPVNRCWHKDTVQDIEEELTDAIFNALVLTKKLHDPTVRTRGDTAATMTLMMLIETWERFNAAKGELQ